MSIHSHPVNDPLDPARLHSLGVEAALYLAAVDERMQAALAGARTGPSRLSGWWKAAQATLRTWQERARSRSQLATLSPRLLADVGFTDADVMQETAKWFWQR